MPIGMCYLPAGLKNELKLAMPLVSTFASLLLVAFVFFAVANLSAKKDHQTQIIAAFLPFTLCPTLCQGCILNMIA
jgi:hypothetical protein